MTARHPWVRPLVSVALAVTLAVTGFLLAPRLLPTPALTAAPAPVTVAALPAEVLSPELVPETVDDLEALVAGGPSGADAPSVPAVIGDSGSAKAILDVLSTAVDPEAAADEVVELRMPPATDCGSECPEGLLATVQPQTWADALRIVSVGMVTSDRRSVEIIDDCAASDVPVVRIVTNAPVAFELRWAPQGSPDSPKWVRAQTADAALAQWREQQRTNPRVLVATCVALTEPLAVTLYDASVTAWPRAGVEGSSSDDGAAHPVTRTFSFNAAGDPAVPSSEFFLVPGTTDLVVATVPLRDGENVDFGAWFTDSGLSACGSGGRPTDRVLQLGETRVVAVEPAALLAANLQPDYTRRATALFSLPEGVSIDLCANTLRDGERVTWAGAVIHTADRLVPTISLHSVWSSLGEGERLTVQGYLGTGEPCGFWQSAGATERSVFTPSVSLCDYRDRYGSAGVDPSTNGALGSLGALGQFTFTIDDNLTESAATPRVIDLDALAPCHGACAAPRDSFHVLRWLDSDSEQYAVVIAEVSWSQGDSNGVLRSTVSEVTTDEASLLWPSPFIDTDEFTFELSGYNPTTREAIATATFTTNQPANYSARLLPMPGTGTLCTLPSANTIEEGRAGTGPVTVRFGGLCGGGRYQLRIVLTGDDGTITSFGAPTSGPVSQLGQYLFGGPGFSLSIPPVETDIRVRWLTSTTVPDAARRGFDMTLTSVTVDGSAVVGPLSGVCLGGLTTGESRTFTIRDIPLSEHIHVVGRVSTSESCTTVRVVPNDIPLVFEADVTYDQLLAGVRVRFAPPAGTSFTKGAQTVSGWVELTVAG